MNFQQEALEFISKLAALDSYEIAEKNPHRHFEDNTTRMSDVITLWESLKKVWDPPCAGGCT